MQYEEARFFLSQTAGRGIELGLDRMRSFMKELGDPQEKTAFIHVAGTNGKGSVSAMTASVLAESGSIVGRYCSPWVFEYEEMIQRQDKEEIHYISKEELISCVEKMEVVCRKWQQQGKELPTAFELETAMAFMMFARWDLLYWRWDWEEWMMPPILSVHHLYRLLHLLLWIIWVCWEILLLRLQKKKRGS